MYRRLLSLVLVFGCTHFLQAGGQPAPTFYHPLTAVAPRCIGPATMSGRIVEVAVVESRPSTLYVASASGGLWKTVNNGTTWKPVFEFENTVALGTVAVAPSNPNIVWVGTGEANARNSVSWGDGVYKSINGGLSWKNMGLRDTHHIARIVIHPKNPDIVYVAALGRLWGPNQERGVFKTANGGKTWEQVLFVNTDTGVVDLAMDPTNPSILYAASYQVRRDAFSGGNPDIQGGPGSALLVSRDAGKTWQKMAVGLPTRQLGRCGFSIYRGNSNVIFAIVQTDRTESGTAGQAANLKTWTFEDENGKELTLPISKENGGVFRSDDQGRTWRHLNSLVPRPFYYGQIRVDPTDEKRVYVLGVQLHVSNDGGQTFLTQSKDGGKSFSPLNYAKGTHLDYHSLWIDPKNADHLVLGSDGGLNFSYDRGVTWEQLKNLPISQFYAVGVDMRKPYRVYGGLQDNGTWGAPSRTYNARGITNGNWINYLGYDGYYCQVDPTDANTLYAEGQYGILRRINVTTLASVDIKPKADKEKPAYRFNWNAPILLSPHDPKTVYFGGNHVFKSVNRGDEWKTISPDLTHGDPGPSDSTGNTITTLAESKLKAGLLYVGTDDGRVHITQDGGKTWTDLSKNIPGVPADRWISRVECSPFEEGTAFLSIDRHRNNDFAPYLFKTTDHGKTWKSLRGNLPDQGPVYVIKADPANKELLYVGTEYGLFLTLNGGGIWLQQAVQMPTVAVHDVVVHPRDRELVIATHGRGIYIMDVAPLQELTVKSLSAKAHLCDVKPMIAYRPRQLQPLPEKAFYGQNPPYGALIYFHLPGPVKTLPILTIKDAKGAEVAQLPVPPVAQQQGGLYRVVWNLGYAGGAKFNVVPPGTYIATLRVGDLTLEKNVVVEAEE